MHIIPLPSKIKLGEGVLHLHVETGILTDAENLWNAEYLRELLAASTAFPLKIRIVDQAVKNVIQLRMDDGLEDLGREGYRLEVLPDKIEISAHETTGVFYGIQTLRQLLPVEIEERNPISGMDWVIPCVLIEDKPRFAWRGFMLDEGRHFHGKETVQKTLDLMALQKLNVFHWHLTEDQGWRIEIKKYPELTRVGSHRDGTSKDMLGKRLERISYDGYYTQDEIREIVDYAANRHIMIVPEIEMPGHSLAALASYPYLSCTGGPFKVATNFGIFPDIYCPGKETTFNFLQHVLNEIIELFPAPYIHIGGDETPNVRWKKCPDCQRRIQEEGLKDEKALQVYFTNRIASFLASKGRTVIGWNAILQDGLTKGAVVQFWVGGRRRLIRAVRTEKRAVIMSSYLDAYLDHSYSLMPLSRAYNYEPVPLELDENDAGSILGLEFPLWSEWVPNRARLDYQVYPRMIAASESGWTQKKMRNYKEFRHRLVNFLCRLDRLDVHYAPLNEAEPINVKQWFGTFTLLQPQTKTARK